jgi:hypothetical protein
MVTRTCGSPLFALDRSCRSPWASTLRIVASIGRFEHDEHKEPVGADSGPIVPDKVTSRRSVRFCVVMQPRWAYTIAEEGGCLDPR